MGMKMPSWYDIAGLDDRSNEECLGIVESKARIQRILKEENARGLPYSRMALSGFSQGGALALFTGFQMETVEEKLSGIVVMSGYLASAKQFKVTPGLESTPILHCHGTNDPMVKFHMAEKTRNVLTGEHNVSNYTFKTYPMNHEVIPEEMQEVVSFFSTILPSSDECFFKAKEPSAMSIKELKAAIRGAGLGNQAVGLLEKTDFVKLLEDNKK
jgi:lysophospholipase-2